MIFQLLDDHSRYAVASHVAESETVEAAIVVFDKAVTAHGVPQRLLSDNGMALNPTRRGYVGQLVEHVSSLGVEAITGKPYKPTTQGKNERFHQTLFRYLDKQPLAASLADLQAQVDAFDHIYNTDTTPSARTKDSPAGSRPLSHGRPPRRPRPRAPNPRNRSSRRPPRNDCGACRFRPDLPSGTTAKKLTSAGTFWLAGVNYLVGGPYRFQQVLLIIDADKITVADLEGEILIEHTRPAPGITYVGNGRPRGPWTITDEVSPKS